MSNDQYEHNTHQTIISITDTVQRILCPWDPCEYLSFYVLIYVNAKCNRSATRVQRKIYHLFVKSFALYSLEEKLQSNY